MKLPSREKCFELMDKYRMYDNIKEHSKMVERVAVFLARELKKKGIDIDEDLISRAALLHDIGKVEELENGGKHDKIGEKILKKEGYEQLGIFCSKHYLGREKDLKTFEEKIISYADKRVLHDKIVDLEKRFEDGKVRYPNVFVGGMADEAMDISCEIEKEIFSKLDIEPRDVGSFICHSERLLSQT